MATGRFDRRQEGGLGPLPAPDRLPTIFLSRESATHDQHPFAVCSRATDAMSGELHLDNFGRQFGRQISSGLVILILLATPVSATDAVTVCQQALTTDISKYTDNQFKSTLCTASIVYQRSAKTGDHAAMSACMKAIEKMLPDFARRFPGRKPHEVVGRCE